MLNKVSPEMKRLSLRILKLNNVKDLEKEEPKNNSSMHEKELEYLSQQGFMDQDDVFWQLGDMGISYEDLENVNSPKEIVDLYNSKASYFGKDTIYYMSKYGVFITNPNVNLRIRDTNPYFPLIDSYGNKKWYKNGKLYYEIDTVGNQYWYKDGYLHRDNDQPAVIYSGGNVEYWKNGKQYFPGKELK